MATVTEQLLTTVDNPWDPFLNWREWYAWDAAMGYHTPGLLARIVVTSYDLSEVDQDLAITQAMDEIVSDNFSGMHKIVTREIEVDDDGILESE